MADCQMAQEGIPDFSELPDVAWVSILSYLGLRDRYHAALTCHALNDCFNHPSLWYSVKILLLGDHNKYKWLPPSNIVLPIKYIHLINRFGKYFQDLTLIFHGYLTKLPEDCANVITALAENCRLESLTLEIGSFITKQDLYLRKARETDVEPFIRLVSNAFRLRKFTLSSWPMYPGMTTSDILTTLVSNPKLIDLKELILYWQSASKATWASQNVVLPQPVEILTTVKHFNNLTVLCLRSPMLSEEIILALGQSNRSPLQRLGVLVCYSQLDENSIPAISSEAWSKLHAHSPQLVVDFTVVTRVPYFYLAGLLRPEVPVFSVSFMKHSRCGADDVFSIADKYTKTLRKFVNYTDGSELDDAVLYMVTKCSNMDYFISYCPLHHTTVCTLAKLRGPRWYMFQVYGDVISTAQITSHADADEVLRQGEDGEYYVNRPASDYQSDEEREAILTNMSKEVGEMLGQKWAPVGRDDIRKTIESEKFGQSKIISEKAYLAAQNDDSSHE